MLPVEAVVLNDVKQARHRREEQHAVAARLELGEQLVHHHELARVGDHVLALDKRRAGLGAVEEVRMVAHLAEVHHDVLHARRAHLLARRGERRQVAQQHAPVQVHLHRRERQVDRRLRLGRQPLFDVRLQPAEQAALQQPVQLADERLVDVARLRVEGGVEKVGGREDIGEEEVEQRPQLMQVVLDRRARQQQPARRPYLAEEPRELRVLILEAMRLVDDEASPAHLLERRDLRRHRLLGRQAHVVVARRHERLALLRALVLGAVQHKDAQLGAELGKLALPVAEHRERQHDQVRLGERRGLLLQRQVAEQRDRLQRLAEAHLVGEDAVEIALVQREHPVEPLELVVAQPATRDVLGLVGETNHLLLQLVLLLRVLLLHRSGLGLRSLVPAATLATLASSGSSGSGRARSVAAHGMVIGARARHESGTPDARLRLEDAARMAGARERESEMDDKRGVLTPLACPEVASGSAPRAL